MKLRYLFTALLFTGAAAPLQAQSIDHMRKLLQEIQQEIDCLEKEQAETLKPRKEPQPVESTEYVDGVIAVDTLPSGNDAVMIVLFNDNTWKYLRNRDYVKDSEIYTRCWDTTKLFPYRDVVKLATCRVRWTSNWSTRSNATTIPTRPPSVRSSVCAAGASIRA